MDKLKSIVAKLEINDKDLKFMALNILRANNNSLSSYGLLKKQIIKRMLDKNFGLMLDGFKLLLHNKEYFDDFDKVYRRATIFLTNYLVNGCHSQ